MFTVGRDDWAGLALTAVIAAAFFAEPLVPAVYAHLGLSAAALAAGLWWTPLTHMVVHGGLMHLAFNATALLSFSRALSVRTGGVRLLALFLLSGLAGAAMFLAINPAGSTPMVGASGAVFGFWGAAARLAPAPVGAVPLFSPPVASAVLAVVVVNVLTVGLLWALSGGRSGLAWEAHLGGFLFGLLSAPLFAKPADGPWG